jgi:ribosomal protein L29
METRDIEEKVLILAKKLIDLKMKKATRQSFKSHEFKATKRELSKLLTLQNNS